MRGRYDQFEGCLLGGFAGDALGAVWEGQSGAADRAAGHARLEWRSRREELTYTDDTQLALALARHLLGPDPLVLDQEAWAAAMVAAFEVERGYGGGFVRLVQAWQDGVDVRQASTAVFAQGSFGNGAAMRAAPVGLRWVDDRASRRDAAEHQAVVSHAHPIGIDGSSAIAEAVAVAVHGEVFTVADLDAVTEVCRTPAMREAVRAVPDWVERWESGTAALSDVAAGLGCDVVAERSVPAALWAAVVGEDLVDTLALAIGLGGDTDTIASMAGNIRGAADGRDAVPVEWITAMEDGPHGVTHALDLAARLHEAARGTG